MKKTILLFLLCMISTIGALAADVTPSDKYLTRKVTCSAFNAVRTNTSIDIIYTVGARNVEIYAPDNLIDYIKVSVDNGELRVSYKENMNIRGGHKSYVKVSAPDVTKFMTASSGSITVKSPIKQVGKEVSLTCNSSGEIKTLNIECGEIKLTTNSSGDIETGTLKSKTMSIMTNSSGDIETGAVTATENAKILTNSSGDIDLPTIVAGKVSINANSSGDIEIGSVNTDNVAVRANSSGSIEVKSIKSTSVDAMASSSGDIKIYGNCATAVLRSASSGSVNATGLKANDVTATVYGSGNVRCTSLQSLNATRIGSGTITYSGSPADITTNDARGGGIKPAKN